MSDYKSSLPVRSEQETDHVRIRLVDGAIDSQVAEIDSDKNLHVEMHGNKSDNSDVILKLNDAGKVITDGIYNGTTNLDPASIGMIASTRGGEQEKEVTAVAGAVDVVALDVALHDEDGNAYTELNPMPVILMNDTVGDDICDYQTASSVLADADGTLTYTVSAGKIMSLKQIIVSASGRFKAVVKFGAATKVVVFGSSSDNNVVINFPIDTALAAASTVSVVVTNRDKQPMDVYCNFMGTER